MSVTIEVRNPLDLTTTFAYIHIQRADSNSAGAMSDLATSVAIDTSTASDLSPGYTSYVDSSGDIDTHYYRFRYKATGGSAYSDWSDIFQAGNNVLSARFRRMMRDANSNNYYFIREDIDFFLEQAIARLWPITWQEQYSDTAFVPDGTTKIFNFPVGVTRVNSLEIIDSSGVNVGTSIPWRVRGKMVIFDNAPDSNLTIRAYIEKMFTKLSEVPSVWDSHILNIMRLQAFETMEGDRSKFYKYNSVAKPEGGNLPSLDKIIARIEGQIKMRENQLRRVRTAGTMKLV